MDMHELERQRDCYRAAYETTLHELDAIKAAARRYLEHAYWRGNGERLAALCGYQHPCADRAARRADDAEHLRTLADAVADGRAWED